MLHELADAADVRCDDRYVVRHGFEQRGGRAFAAARRQHARGEDEGVRGTQQRALGAPVTVPSKRTRSLMRAASAWRRARLRSVACDQPFQIRALGEIGHRFEQAFDRHQACDREQREAVQPELAARCVAFRRACVSRREASMPMGCTVQRARSISVRVSPCSIATKRARCASDTKTTWLESCASRVAIAVRSGSRESRCRSAECSTAQVWRACAHGAGDEPAGQRPVAHERIPVRPRLRSRRRELRSVNGTSTEPRPRIAAQVVEHARAVERALEPARSQIGDPRRSSRPARRLAAARAGSGASTCTR